MSAPMRVARLQGPGLFRELVKSIIRLIPLQPTSETKSPYKVTQTKTNANSMSKRRIFV